MRGEPTLAYTVHHKGQIYRAGMTAEDLGPVATEIGAHAWEGGNAPKGAATQDPAAQPPATPPTPESEQADEEPAAEPEPAPRRSGGATRRSGSN